MTHKRLQQWVETGVVTALLVAAMPVASAFASVTEGQEARVPGPELGPGPQLSPGPQLDEDATGQETESPSYDPSGKRDPFQPATRPVGPASIGAQRTPLQQFELSQLRLVAIIRGAGNSEAPRAVVEDSAGLGYIMRVGTPIGRNDGRVTAIEGDRIVIEEWPMNVFGERRRAVIVKELDAGEEAKR